VLTDGIHWRAWILMGLIAMSQLDGNMIALV